jgi:predicted nucleic acid-binding protein
MGQLTLPSSGAAYVDTNALIYFVERIEPYYTASLPLWDALDQGQVLIETSELTLLEVLVKPLHTGDAHLVALYRRILTGTLGLTAHPVGRALLEQAALLRAGHGLKTPDAIHAATAQAAGSAQFITNDAGFRRVTGLPVVVLSEVVSS